LALLTDKILSFLSEHNVEFKELDHEETPTSEDSARARGESLAIGGKTLFVKSKHGYHLMVLSAAEQADNNKIRQVLKSQKLRFASRDELWELAGVKSGALPPFGEPILPYPLYIDESIRKQEKIAFNAGILTKSIIMKMDDYLRIVKGQYCNFT
jgi:Ala-tRNA(Pro) deacylase